MYSTKKSKKSDLIGEMFLYLFVSLCFGGFGFGFLFIDFGNTFLLIFCSIFILVFVGFALGSLNILFKYFIFNRPYEYYITKFTVVSMRGADTSRSTVTYKRKGSEIGLPDRFKDLTSEQNKMLENGTFIFSGDLKLIQSYSNDGYNLNPELTKRLNEYDFSSNTRHNTPASKPQSIGLVPCTVGYVVFCIILFFILRSVNSTDVNIKTENTIEVVAKYHKSSHKYTTTVNNVTKIGYDVTYTYVVNDETFYYKTSIEVRLDSELSKPIVLHANKDNGELLFEKQINENFYVTFFLITIGIFSVFIGLNVLIIIFIRSKGVTVAEYYNNLYTSANNQKRIINANDPFGQDNYNTDKDDPFRQDDCKYNIDKDDPFSDFYKKGGK